MATATLNITNTQTITVTLASLANATAATSSAIDNGTNKFLRALVQVKVKTAASAVTANGRVYVWMIRSADNGTTYDDSGRQLLFVLPANANATTYVGSGAVELDTAKWKIAVENQTGAALDSTGANHLAQFAGIKVDVA